MLTAIITLSIAIPAISLAIYAAKKLDARDRAAGRYQPTGGSLKPTGRTTGRLLF